MKFRPALTAEELIEKIKWNVDPQWRSVDIGPGWYRLIWDLVEDLDKLDCKYGVGQVKEKFGGLRFYVDIEHTDACPGNNGWMNCPIAMRVNQAESASYRICESCGHTASAPPPQPKMGSLNLIVGTLCDRCRND